MYFMYLPTQNHNIENAKFDKNLVQLTTMPQSKSRILFFFAIYTVSCALCYLSCEELFAQVFKETVCKSIVELFRVLSLMIFKCLPFVFA